MLGNIKIEIFWISGSWSSSILVVADLLQPRSKMQWNVEQAKTHAQRPGEYFPPFNRIFSFVLPYLSHGRTAQLGWLDRNPRGYIVGLKISKPFLPQTQLGFLLPKILEIFSASFSSSISPVRRFPTKDFSSKYLEYTSRAVSHEFHKVSSVLHVSSEDRSVKIGAIRPRSFGPNRNLRRGIDILGGSYTINPRLAFLARENGVTGMRRPAKSNQLIREELMTGIS